MPAKKPAAPQYMPSVRQYRNSPNPRINPDKKHYYVGAVITKKGAAQLTHHVCETPREDPQQALADAETSILRLQRGQPPGNPKCGPDKLTALLGTAPSLPPMRLLMLNLPKQEVVMLYHLAKGGTHLELPMTNLDPVAAVTRLRSRFLMTDSTAHDLQDEIIRRVTSHAAAYIVTINATGSVCVAPH